MSNDLVCGCEVDDEKTRFHSDYDQKMFFFCSPECKRSFDDHPDRYIQEQARKELGQ